MGHLTIYSALGCFAVMASMIIFVIIYIWHYRRKETRREESLNAYTAEIEDFFRNNSGPIPEEFFSDKVPHVKYRIFLLRQYVLEHTMAKRSPHKDIISVYAKTIGLTHQLRRQSKRGNKWYRADALRMLAELGNEADMKLFESVIENSSFKPAIMAALTGLAKHDATSKVRYAFEKMCDTKHPNRDELLSVLSNYSDAAVEQCVDMIGDARLPVMLRASVIALVGVKKTKSSVPALEEVLENSDDSELHLHAIEALEKVGNEGSCLIILPFLNASDFRVRLKAVNALERLAGDRYIEESEVLLGDEDLFVRRNAAEAISRMGKKGMDRLRSLVSSSNNDISIITKMVIAEKKFRKTRWRFRYGDSIH